MASFAVPASLMQAGTTASLDAWVVGHAAALSASMELVPAASIASALAPAPCLVAAVLLFLWLLGKGHADRLGLLVLQGTSLAGVGILNLCLKAAFARPRPEVALVAETGLSFPSGHSMLCMAAYGLLAIVATRRLRTERAKYAASMAAGIAIALLGASRVLLGTQYPRTCSTASWCRLHGF